MDIAFYISELIKEYDEVGIPGAGTIYRKKISAAYNPHTRKFDPPTSLLGFTSAQNEADILRRYIGKQKNISEASADFFTRKFGSEFNMQLETEGRADLSPLGLVLNNNGNYTFEQHALDDNAGNYGLLPVDERDFSIEEERAEIPDIENAPDLNVETLAEEIISIPETSYKTENSSFKTDFSVTLFDKIVLKEKSSIWSESDEGNDAKKFRVNKKWIIYGSIFLIIGALAYTGYYFSEQIAEIYKTLTSSSAAPVKEHTVEKGLDSIAVTASAPVDSLIDTISPEINHLEAQQAVIQPGQRISSYEIVGGTRSTYEEAEIFVKELIARGINASILKNSAPPEILISLGSYQSRAAAMADLPHIQNEIDKTARIVEIKTSKK